MTTALITFCCFAFFAPIMASIVKCVPKWWHAEIDSHMDPDFNRRLKGFMTKPRTSISFEPLWHFLHYVFMLIAYIPAVVLFLIVGYFMAWFKVVEDKCPYNDHILYEDSSAHRAFMEWRDVMKDVLLFRWS